MRHIKLFENYNKPANKKYQQWVIQDEDGLYYADDASRKEPGWVENRNLAAYYNYAQAERLLPTLKKKGLTVVDGILPEKKK